MTEMYQRKKSACVMGQAAALALNAGLVVSSWQIWTWNCFFVLTH